jgi:hypothetical protein
LRWGSGWFLKFATEAGAITPEERARLRSESWQALLEAADAQAAKQAATEPAAHFLRLLAAVLASQRAHIADTDGDAPDSPARWGWRRLAIQRSNGTDELWQPQGRRIGWTDGESVYLEPDASYSEAARLAGEQGESLTAAPQTLRRRLFERGFLLSTEEARQTLLTRKTVEGTRRKVLHLAARHFYDDGQDGPETRPTKLTNQPDHETCPRGNLTTENPQKHWEKQRIGQFGQFEKHPIPGL